MRALNHSVWVNPEGERICITPTAEQEAAGLAPLNAEAILRQGYKGRQVGLIVFVEADDQGTDLRDRYQATTQGGRKHMRRLQRSGGFIRVVDRKK